MGPSRAGHADAALTFHTVTSTALCRAYFYICYAHVNERVLPGTVSPAKTQISRCKMLKLESHNVSSCVFQVLSAFLCCFSTLCLYICVAPFYLICCAALLYYGKGLVGYVQPLWWHPDSTNDWERFLTPKVSGLYVYRCRTWSLLCLQMA